MPAFFFKIILILIGIIIWKTVFASFMKAKSALHDDSRGGDDDDSRPRAQIDLETQWRQTAEQLFCTFDSGKKADGSDMCITGRVSGHAVTIKRFGRNYVRYFVSFRNATRIQVCVVRDIQTIAERILDGHPIFPSKCFFSSQEPDFYCSAESEEAFDRFLEIPSYRSAVLNLVRLFPAGMFNNEGVSIRLRATAPDEKVLAQMLAIANALEKPSRTPMPDLLTVQKKGLLSIPADFSPAMDAGEEEEDIPKRFSPLSVQVEPSKRTSRLRSRKTDDPAISGRTVVIRIPPEAKPDASADAGKAGVERKTGPALSKSSAQKTPAEPEKSPVPVQNAAVADNMTVESVCAALFSKSFPGAEERAAFDAMKGRRVRWSGEVQTVLPFSMDFTFGSGKGVKATLLVHEMKQGQSAFPVKIKAVAAFPPELQAALESSKGKTVSFEGDLLKFEPFAREIYLQNASLVS